MTVHTMVYTTCVRDAAPDPNLNTLTTDYTSI